MWGGDGARNKHLLPATWRRSNRFLTAVLQAYLDGDGHFDVKNDRWRLGFTDNIWLARDLRTIAARLGIICRIRRQPRAADPRGGQFAGTANFWHRGEIRMLPGVKVAPPGQIVGLRLSKRRRFFDVGVEGEPHLFALASGILTHNCRPNPPVGALGDKWRPATSELMVFCKSAKRYFDLDATREPAVRTEQVVSPLSGAPPLDWWKISPGGYEGAHYATWPAELCVNPIKSMCPPGGTVLDPFVGSGTTLSVATGHGRNAIGIDLDERNFDLALGRVGPFMLTLGNIDE